MKRLNIVIILLLSWTASFGYYIRTDSIPAVDSTLMYSMPLWVANSMAYEVQRGRQCGELVKFQAEEIQKGIAVEIKLRDENNAQVKQIVSQTTELALAHGAVDTSDKLLEAQKDLTQHERGQKNRWKVGTITAITFMILMQVFGN